MRFPPALLDEIRARLPVSQVVARKVKLKRQGREYAGLSPFKVEKSASFFVNDQKGFYHCFASGEHGDIFTFLMKTEGLSFPEAIERLAGEAGVSLPKAAPEAREQQDVRTRLLAVVEASAVYFERQLRSSAGREGLRYLEGRGLSAETIKRFRLGFALPGRSALKENLAQAGFTTAEMNASGMLIHGEDIPVSYDRFRNRVMFPITDMKDRVVAFGGRGLEKDAKPKYLNSPETPLFHKGNLLFNAAKARSAAYEHGQIIVVEGYMDAIALAQAGFNESVAPLGTALTADQLTLLWRMNGEPILCFDGDGAGRKAAFRAIETALPHLKAGQSLRFAFLPDGLDPDDLLRQQGAEAMQSVLDKTRPFADVLWDREWGAGEWSTPERRAQLEQNVRAKVAMIENASVRGFYEEDMRDRLAQVFGRKSFGGRDQDGQSPGGSGQGGWNNRGSSNGDGRPAGGRPPFSGGAGGRQPWTGAKGGNRGGAGRGQNRQNGGGFGGSPGPTSSLRGSKLVADQIGQPTHREALILRVIVNHPWLIDDWSEAIAELDIPNKGLAGLRDAILQIHALSCPLDRSELRDQLRGFGHDRTVALLEQAATHKGDKFAEADAPRETVELGWQHLCALHARQVALSREIEAAQQSWHAEQTDEAFARLRDLNMRLNGTDGKEAIIEGYGGNAKDKT
jgi:DNA primase